MNSIKRTAERLAAKRNQEDGFTLIELLVVIVILGVLSAVVVFAVSGISDKGDVAACKSDAKTLEVAVEAYRAQAGSYPTAAQMQDTVADPGGVLVPGFMRDLPGSLGAKITYDASSGEVNMVNNCA